MIYTKEEIEQSKEACILVSKTLGILAKEVKEGVTGLKLDKIAYEYIKDNGGEPAFLGLYDFPNTLCISPNSQVVHGIPSNEIIKNGDIISIDCGVKKNGFCGDQAYTFEVGEVEESIKKLLKVTKECLYIGINKFVEGNKTGDVGYGIQYHAEINGFGVVRELCGHGVGKTIHEEPQIPNYGLRNKGEKIKNGMIVAIEPMINLGSAKIQQMKDGWTIHTKDRKPSAHYEHNIAIVNGSPEILTTFDFIYEALGINNRDN